MIDYQAKVPLQVKQYIDWTVTYTCLAAIWTPLDPSAEDLANNKWWRIIRIEDWDGMYAKNDVLATWDNIPVVKQIRWEFQCSAEDLTRVQAYDYSYSPL